MALFRNGTKNRLSLIGFFVLWSLVLFWPNLYDGRSNLLPGDVARRESGGESVVPCRHRRPVGSRASEGVAMVTGRLGNGGRVGVLTVPPECTDGSRRVICLISWS